MSQLTLYTNPQSRGRIARWALEEVGAPYERVILDYEGAMKSPDYLAINPMGKVPAIRHGETVVTECAAICAYLADAFPERELAPPPAERGAYYRWLFFTSGPVEAAVTARSLNMEPPAEQARRVGFGSVDQTLKTLEGALEASPYIAGDRFTAADVYVGAQVFWGMMTQAIAPNPVFKDYTDRLLAREAFQRANALDDADAAAAA